MLPFQKECLGHVLVPANSEGNEITQWILKDNGKIVPRRTENNLTAQNLALSNEAEKGKIDTFEKIIRYIFGNYIELALAALDLK